MWEVSKGDCRENKIRNHHYIKVKDYMYSFLFIITCILHERECLPGTHTSFQMHGIWIYKEDTFPLFSLALTNQKAKGRTLYNGVHGWATEIKYAHSQESLSISAGSTMVWITCFCSFYLFATISIAFLWIIGMLRGKCFGIISISFPLNQGKLQGKFGTFRVHLCVERI